MRTGELAKIRFHDDVLDRVSRLVHPRIANSLWMHIWDRLREPSLLRGRDQIPFAIDSEIYGRTMAKFGARGKFRVRRRQRRDQ